MYDIVRVEPGPQATVLSCPTRGEAELLVEWAANFPPLDGFKYEVKPAQ